MSLSPREMVQRYYDRGYRCVFWPRQGDNKGPREKNWTEKIYALTDFHDDDRCGLLLGVEITPGHYLYDVDIDWSPGATIAQHFLPETQFIFGHGKKRISHCFYLSGAVIATLRYEDINKTCLIELRGTKADGTPGMQTMVPPSVWSKSGSTEPLTWIKDGDPTFVEQEYLKSRVALAAVGMLLAKHFGTHGFGHETRLAWAGFLLRLGVSTDDLIRMGEAISTYCENREVHDVRTVVESTVRNLNPTSGGNPKKVAGGPALETLLGTHGKAIIKLVRKWLGSDKDDFYRVEGKIVANHQGNIRLAMDLLGVTVTHNEFADKMLIDYQGRRRPLEDREMNNIWLRMDEDLHLRPSFVFFEKVVKDVGWSHPFHPVKDYLNGLTWDGTPRCDEWLITAAGAEDTPYVRAVSAIVLIAAVRRIKSPGCKYDELLVIESGQGLNKSSALRTLCPDPEWFSDDLPLNVRAQQMIEATLGKWIIEASELSGMRISMVEQLKSTLSRQVDGPARMAYAHEPVERQRQFIIVGTTNSPQYLVDQTGARRFWPVKTQRFDVDWIRTHRDHLWAEAVIREGKHESTRLPEQLWTDAEVQQEKRRETDPWELTIRQMLEEESSAIHDWHDGYTRVPDTQIWDLLGIPVERRDYRGQMRITQIMHRWGFKRSKTTIKDDLGLTKTIRIYLSLEPQWLKTVAPRVFDHEEPREPGDEVDSHPSSTGKNGSLLWPSGKSSGEPPF